MNDIPPVDFHIALNIMGLCPRNPEHWRDRIGAIASDLANAHEINAGIWVGAYVLEPQGEYRPFYLFAFRLDLAYERDLKRYHEVESVVRDVVQKYAQ